MAPGGTQHPALRLVRQAATTRHAQWTSGHRSRQARQPHSIWASRGLSRSFRADLHRYRRTDCCTRSQAPTFEAIAASPDSGRRRRWSAIHLRGSRVLTQELSLGERAQGMSARTSSPIAELGFIAGTVLFCVFTIVAAAAWNRPAPSELYELVITNGRVMDPESSLDANRNIGLRSGKIAAISGTPLSGKTTIDAKGLVVAPGFIDLHEHGQEPRNYQFQAHDGVTTSLELEAGVADISSWYSAREGKSLIHFGASIGHIPVRMKVMHELGGFLPTGDAAHRPATAEELTAIRAGIEEGLKQGALAEGMGINYTAAASHSEIIEMFRLAAKYGASVHVHLRYGGVKEPNTGLAALEEAIAAAAETGAALHVVHITSMGLRDTPDLIAMVKGAKEHGLDVTTECYPYTAGSTALQSAIFDPGWQERMAITYKDLQWAETGERLTAETFEKYRRQGGIVVIHSIPELVARSCVADPNIMVASDGMMITGTKVHPRGQATF